MLRLFKKKSKVDKLHSTYESLMSDWAKLSNTNRRASDAKYAEAQKILDKIEDIKKAEA